MGRWVGWLTSAITASGLGAAFLAWVRDHPGVAIALAIASPVVGELLRRNRSRIVDHLDQWMVGRLSRFGGHYRKYLLARLRSVDLKGLPTIGFHTPELDEVFVDVSLVFRAPHQVPANPLAVLPPEISERQVCGRGTPALVRAATPTRTMSGPARRSGRGRRAG